MKKIRILKKGSISFLVLFFLLSCPLTSNAEVHFFDIKDIFINKINQLRTNPLMVAQNMGLDILKISRRWEGIDLKAPILTLNLNEALNKMAKEHIIEMVDKGYIGHESDFGTTLEQRANYFGYDGIFNGESITVFCFENFVSLENAINILWLNMVKDAFYRLSAEGAPLLFPLYQDFGVALAGAKIKLNGTTYNAYILCMEFGVPGFSGYFLGRVYYKNPLPEYGVSNLQVISFQNNTFSSNTIYFLDGSFYLKWDYISSLWLKITDPAHRYQDKIIQVSTPSLSIPLLRTY